MVIVKIAGGLGNQMFMYCYAKALQRRGYQVYLDTETFFEHEQSLQSKWKKSNVYSCGLDNFQIDIPQIEPSKSWFKYLVGKKKKEWVAEFCRKYGLFHYYDWTNTKFNDKYLKEMMYIQDRSYVSGYFQTEKIFAKFAKEIRQSFLPKKEINFPANFLSKRTPGLPLVSLHFRRTDYKYTSNLDMLELNYYMKAIDYLKEKIGRFDLCVFSDESSWVKENLTFDSMNIMYICDYGKFKDYEELLLMSYCNHNIIANSTFSWWGAWLNRNQDKIVIAPEIWLNNKDYRIVPDQWIKM